MTVPSYRITLDDLPDMDKKTGKAVEPLLDGLNRALPAVIAGFNGLLLPDVRRMSLSTGAAVADSFPFKFSTSVSSPTTVQLNNIIPRDPAHSLTTGFVMNGWQVTTGVVAVQFITGLLANNTYDLVFVVT